MPWLHRNGQRVAAATIATTARQRRRGLLDLRADQRPTDPWALVIPRCRSVHTIGMHFPIDVAYVAADGTVLAVTTMRPGRIGRPRWTARTVVETDAGQCQRWGLALGDRLEVSE